MTRSSYSYCSDHTVSAPSAEFHGRTLQTKAGFFAVLLLEERVDRRDPIYRLVEGLRIDPALRAARLQSNPGLPV